jgi:hypothetical protein
MSRLNIPTRDEAPEATHGVLDAMTSNWASSLA